MLQHSNVKNNIQIFILCNKMMYLVILWSLSLTLAIKYKHLMVLILEVTLWLRIEILLIDICCSCE